MRRSDTPTRPRRFATLLLCGSAAVFGCETAGPQIDTSARSSPGSGVELEPLEPADGMTLDAADMYPSVAEADSSGGIAERTDFFEAESGEDRSLEFADAPASGPDRSGEAGRWLITRHGEEVESERLVRASESGDIVVPRMHNTARELVTVFDPPLVLAPKQLGAGKAHTQSFEMTVRPMDDPDHIDRRGKGTQKIELAGEQEIEINGVSVITTSVRTTFESHFGPAHIKRTTERWFADEDAPIAGLVAERFEERITIFGIKSEQSAGWIVRRLDAGSDRPIAE